MNDNIEELQVLEQEENVITKQLDNLFLKYNIKGKKKEEIMENVWKLVNNQITQEEVCNQ